ncbi:MAG: MBL fold metallo-hydrolase [Desulfobacteraceae bacterium]|nr:MAG: MBL fold metallo-hydrolase [Desulfobacteraceae bacterium]
MYITFYGAAREVTGSMHMVSAETDRILFDCGMFQGRRQESEEKNRVIPFDAGILSGVILSHAHIDHSGRIPCLTKKSFHGRIVCTNATKDTCEYLLPDSAKIQESDANYLNYKVVRNFLSQMKSSTKQKSPSPQEIKNMKKLLKREGQKLDHETINTLIDRYNLKKVTPLYTQADAQQALGYFDGYPYESRITVGHGMTCKFYDAGHILGSAICMLKVQENGKDRNICFSGDFGRFDKPILENPTLVFDREDQDVDLLIMESTYGNREHGPVSDVKEQLKAIINETVERGGSILIPSFAFGRAQELIYVLHELYDAKEVPRIPVYLDSPLATNLTHVFGEHPEVYDRKTHETFLENGKNPFSFKKMNFIQSVEESMALMRDNKPSIIIASSGMCEAGRILHHLRYKIHNEKHTILIVGFMAQHTLGRRILEQGQQYEQSGRKGEPPLLKFLNKAYPLKAHVKQIGGFSAHGDKNELMRLVKESNLNIKKIAVVHGEETQALSFADTLKQNGFSTFVPRRGESVQIQ